MNGETSLLLDTNIVIGFLNGNAAIAHFFSRTKTQQIPRFERGLLNIFALYNGRFSVSRLSTS